MYKTFLWAVTLFMLISISVYAKDNIEVYNTYGNKHHLFIQGRMLHKKEFEKVSYEDGWLTNVWRRVRQLESNEISDAKIIASIQGETFSVQGDDEGYFEFNITLDKAVKAGYIDVGLTIENNAYVHHTLATIIGDQKLVGIISDFDDTLIISEVTDKMELAKNTLFKNYKQRVLVPGMLERFRKILSKNPNDTPSTLFILSGSPQQLFTPIEGFLDFHHFPKHTLILKKAHGDNKDPLTDQFTYKTEKIERLIRLYPHMRWFMFGDSGEKDREVYRHFKEKYPDKVMNYYIRDVVSGEIKEYNKI